MAKDYNDKKAQIERKVNETLKWLDDYQSEPSNPFFYTRLKQHMDNERAGRNISGFVFKPAFATVFVLFGLLFNFLILSNYSNTATSGGYERDDYINAFANEYELEQNDNVLFWYENEDESDVWN